MFDVTKGKLLKGTLKTVSSLVSEMDDFGLTKRPIVFLNLLYASNLKVDMQCCFGHYPYNS